MQGFVLFRGGKSGESLGVRSTHARTREAPGLIPLLSTEPAVTLSSYRLITSPAKYCSALLSFSSTEGCVCLTARLGPEERSCQHMQISTSLCHLCPAQQHMHGRACLPK